LTDKQLQTLEDAVEKARSKGGRETLILLDNVALVVSVANRTVITAMDGDNLKDNVFTHIDSAVIT
jgi:flagellar operon protein